MNRCSASAFKTYRITAEWVSPQSLRRNGTSEKRLQEYVLPVLRMFVEADSRWCQMTARPRDYRHSTEPEDPQSSRAGRKGSQCSFVVQAHVIR